MIGRRGRAALLVALLVLAGCGGGPDPIGVLRGATGGAPDVAAPAEAGTRYPVLGARPVRPTVTPAEERARLSQGLVADRENARWTGAPLPPSPRAAATPAPPLLAAPLAASAAPVSQAPPPERPAEPTPATAPLASLPAAPPAPARLAPAPPVADSPAPAATVPQPAAAAPPPPPALAAPPATAPAPAPAPLAIPQPAPPPRAEPAGPTVSLWFPPGSANLPAPEAARLATLASGSRGARFAVSGIGESQAADPAALGRARALAVAAALRQAGVPPAAITTETAAVDPAGTGGAGARLRVLP